MKKFEPVHKNYLRCSVIGFIVGATILSLLSVWQKYMMGASITAWVGYIVPACVGGGMGAIAGWYYCRLKTVAHQHAVGESYYRTLFDHASDAIFIETVDDRIVDVNPKACELLGYSRDELLNMKVSDLKPPTVHERSTPLILSELEHGKPFETVDQHRDGTLIPVEVTVARIAGLDDNLVLTIVRDIRQRREAEAWQQAVYEVSEAVHSAANLEDLFEVIHQIVGRCLGIQNFMIALTNPHTNLVEFPYFYSEQGEKPPEDAGRGLTRYVLNTKAPLLATPERFKELQEQGKVELRGDPFVDWLGVPLKIGGDVIGVLAVQSYTEEVRLTENHKDFLVFISGQVAMAIERKRTEEQIQQHNQELTVLNRIIAGASLQSEPQGVMEIACRELSRLYRVACTAVYLLDSQKTTAGLAAYWAQNALIPFEEVEIQVAHNPIFQHILDKKNILVAFNAAKDPRLADLHEQFKVQQIESVVAVPLLKDSKEVIGCLLLLDTWPHRFSSDEMNFIWSITDQVTTVVVRMQLEQEHRLLSAAVKNTAETVIITDSQQQIIYVNPAFEKNSGYTRDEVIGKQAFELLSPNQLYGTTDDLRRELAQSVSQGKTWQGRVVYRRKDGSEYIDDVVLSPVYNDQNQLVNYISAHRDITRELELEKQSQHAQKMELIGQLTGGIAHDFNNLLTAINGFSELLQMRLPVNSPLQDMVSNILRSGKRAAGLTGQLLAFSRQQPIQPQIINLNKIITGIDTMLHQIVEEEVQLQTILGTGLWPVRMDTGQIEQVIINLVVNARDSMPEGGHIIIRTSNVTLDEKYTDTHLGARPGDYVMLMVSDTGMGMSEAVKSRIFEPFFTTKAKGKGTGLGLSTVYGIVQQNGGHIWVDSTEGIGTVFKVYLPRAVETGDAAGDQDDDNQQSRQDTGTETVLLVEDNEDVRNFCRRTLQQQGYTVLEARNGLEALRMAKNHAGTIDILLTDVVMPVMNGKILVDKLQQDRPDIKVLFMSGYPNEVTTQNDILKPGMSFLQKPFSPALLLHQIRQVLNDN